jgi:hypothetical protein
LGAVPFAVGRREKLMAEDGFLGVLANNGFKIKIKPDPRSELSWECKKISRESGQPPAAGST